MIDLHLARGDLDAVRTGTVDASAQCLARARQRADAVVLLVDAEQFEVAYTTAYDAYRSAAEAVVLRLGYRVPAVKGSHRITTDIAHAALRDRSDVFDPATADRFRAGRHESEYFDPDRPIEKTAADADWARTRSARAVEGVGVAFEDELDD